MIIKYICEYCLGQYGDKSSIYTCNNCETEICEYCANGLGGEFCFKCAEILNKENK